MMSTKLTKPKDTLTYDMADSRSLKLVSLATSFERRAQKWLVALLQDQGFDGLTQSQLNFLGALDCGPNNASQIAATLGVTRQSVHKTVKELEVCGWLQSAVDPDLRNQRIIKFTLEGERMMSQARALFQQLDAQLFEGWTPERLDEVFALLSRPFEEAPTKA